MSDENGNIGNNSSGDDVFGIGDFFGSAPSVPSETLASPSPDSEVVPPEQVPSIPVPIEDAPKNDVTVPPVSTEPAPIIPSAEEEEFTPEQDVEALRIQLSEAVGKMSEMTLQMQALQQPVKTEMKLPEDPKELSTVDFMQGLNTAELLESPEAFNALLNKVATISARAGQQAGYEMAMRSIPQVVQQSAQQQYNLQAAADNFYKQNPDLAPFKKAVSMAALDFYSKNPAASLEQTLEGAGKATRQILRLRGTTAGRVPAQPAATVGAGGQDRLATSPQLSSMEQQILDVITAAQ